LRVFDVPSPQLIPAFKFVFVFMALLLSDLLIERAQELTASGAGLVTSLQIRLGSHFLFLSSLFGHVLRYPRADDEPEPLISSHPTIS
jgi:hypothetical protein